MVVKLEVPSAVLHLQVEQIGDVPTPFGPLLEDGLCLGLRLPAIEGLLVPVLGVLELLETADFVVADAGLDFVVLFIQLKLRSILLYAVVFPIILKLLRHLRLWEVAVSVQVVLEAIGAEGLKLYSAEIQFPLAGLGRFGHLGE